MHPLANAREIIEPKYLSKHSILNAILMTNQLKNEEAFINCNYISTYILGIDLIDCFLLENRVETKILLI